MTSVSKWLVPFLLLGVFVVVAENPAVAQYSSGFEATVVDPTGAAVQGAEITATNLDTHVVQSAVSDSQGYIHIRNLPLGKYRVEVKAQGFKTWVQSDIKLEGGQIRTLYPQLAIGEKVTNIEVVAELESVDTTSGTVGRTMEQRTVQDSALTGENLYASMATLAPGVTGLEIANSNTGSAGSIGTTPFASESNFQINAAGQRQEANEYQVDGTTVNGNSRDGVVNITPEPDTVAEMNVTASTFSANKGVQSGALIEIFTKPGTDQFHGSLSEVHADNLLMARNEFEPNPFVMPKYIRNDFGGTFGGPIVKDKTFFFGSLYWMKSVLGGVDNDMLETQQFENYVIQNFPNSMATRFYKAAPPAVFPNPNTSPYTLTVAQIEQNYGSPYSTTANIPSDMVAEAYDIVTVEPINNGFQGHLRIDHNLRGDNDKLFYSMFRNTTHGENSDPRPTYSYINPNSTLYNKVDYLHTFSPTIINELGVAYNRLTGNQPDKVPSLPNVGIQGIDDGFWQWGPSGWVQNNFLVHDTLTWMHKSHSIHFGIDIRRLQDMDNFTNGEDRPFFWFNNLIDFAADQPTSQSGPILDVQTDGVAHNLYQRVLMIYVAPYVQDDWKVNRRLTLNLGVRMDDYGHLSTVMNGHDPIAFYTPGTGSTFAEQVANGGMKVRGSNGIATNSVQYRIAPRIGFAWDVFGNGNTAIRGGYAEFSDKVGEYAYVNNMRTNPPNYADPYISMYTAGTTLSNFSYGISSQTTNGGAQGFAPPPGVSYQVNPNGSLVGMQISVGGIDPNLKPPLVHSWALGIQNKVAGFMIEATYMGTASRDLYIQTDVNRYAGDLIQHDGSQERLNPSFGAVTYGRSAGNANSDLAAFSISKHFAKGWTTHAIYTWGKSLDYTSSNDNGVANAESIFDAQHVAAQYGRSDYDSRHRFSGDAVWDIPGFRTGVAHVITSGWTLAPVIVLQSGQPFTVYNGGAFNPVWNNPSCATAVTTGCQVVGNTGGDYNADGFDYDTPNTPSFGNHINANRSQFLKGVFPVSAFPAPAFGQEGNLGRNTYDGPGFAQVNLSAERTFKISMLGEVGSFELRGEFLNLFNRVNLTNPVSDLSAADFGTSQGQQTPRAIEIVAHIRF